MVEKKRIYKSTTRGAKFEDLVRLGSEYPICKDAKDFINALRPCIDNSKVKYLEECFRGFSKRMQRKMTACLLDEFCGRIDGQTLMSFTGILHVDQLLLQMVHRIDEDSPKK